MCLVVYNELQRRSNISETTRGKTYEERYGDKAKEIREKHCIPCSDEKRLKLKARKRTEKQKENYRKAKKEYYENNEHALMGKTYEEIYGNKEEAEKQKRKRNTPEAIMKRAEAMRGKTLIFSNPELRKKRISKAQMGRVPWNTGLTAEIDSRIKAGETHHWYIHGESYAPYSSEWSPALRNRIRERDDHTCQNPDCLTTQNGREFPVHHIDYDKENYLEINLITLCDTCHIKSNYNREYWQKLFTQIMRKRMGE